MTFMKSRPGESLRLAATGAMPGPAHVFEEEAIAAVNAALAACRPLLVRGEPGVGKSQLARAAAKDLGRAYLQYVVDARTESRDLLWHFDAVERLAEAQLRGALGGDTAQARATLAVENYLHPRPLWWAFDWEDARAQAVKVGKGEPLQPDGGDSKNGCLILVDEIDKAETDVPNGLLEALGSGCFTPQGRDQPVTTRGTPPLVVITTNEERVLPDAFIRRCLVLQLGLPKKPDALIDFLVSRGKAHHSKADKAVLTRAAELLARDRKAARDARLLPLPGQAEYLDLVRAVLGLKPADPDQQLKMLEQVARFTLKKHPEAAP